MCIRDREAYNGAMSQHLLNPVEDLAQALKTPIKLAKGASLSRQNNSVNIAEGQSIRVNGGHVLTVTAHGVEAVSYTHLDVYKRQTLRSPMQNQICLTVFYMHHLNCLTLHPG